MRGYLRRRLERLEANGARYAPDVTVHGSKPRFFCGESGDLAMSIHRFLPSDRTSV
jgi:hypothetical protein